MFPVMMPVQQLQGDLPDQSGLLDRLLIFMVESSLIDGFRLPAETAAHLSFQG